MKSSATPSNPRQTSWPADDTFLTRRVTLGEVWVVDMEHASTQEVLCMRTLQGMVNRHQARMYLIHSNHPEHGASDRFWINEYQRQGWVHIAGTLSIHQALAKFQSELSGYVRATLDEPWSVHAAAVHAMLHNGIVAADDVADALDQMGWTALGNTCGLWSDAVSAFNDTVDQYRDDLKYPGMALLRPREYLWDFIMQQQIMPMFSRPKHDTWEGVARIMDTYPPQHILYGYVSDDTVEEEIAVERASSSGKYLVPTHEVSNLSIHTAVLGSKPIQQVAQQDMDLAPLDPQQVNIAIAITDGDNLQVPIMQYPLPQFWNTDKQHSIPLGWSMGVSLSTLAPGIWEYYRNSATPNDEIVSIMGIAYVHASTLPEPTDYFNATFSSMADMGLTTLWSLDSSLTITDEPLWDILENAPARDALHGVLVGYGPSIDKAFRRDTGTPVMITQNGYSEDAQRLKQRIEAICALNPAQRSPVNFIMATNWSTNAHDLYQVLKPLQEKGVRFLTPSQALKLMPNIQGLAKSAVDSDASPGTCLPQGSIEQFGSPILSSPTLAEINNPIPLPMQITASGPERIQSNHTVELTFDVNIHANDMASDFLQHRVLPVVEGYGLSDEFAQYAWMKLAASHIEIKIPFDKYGNRLTVRDVQSSNTSIEVQYDEYQLIISMDTFTSDSRQDIPPVQSSIQVQVDPLSSPGIETLTIDPEWVTFNYELTIGIGEEDGPLVGGVRGKMVGRGANQLMQTHR